MTEYQTLTNQIDALKKLVHELKIKRARVSEYPPIVAPLGQKRIESTMEKGGDFVLDDVEEYVDDTASCTLITGLDKHKAKLFIDPKSREIVRIIEYTGGTNTVYTWRDSQECYSCEFYSHMFDADRNYERRFKPKR